MSSQATNVNQRLASLVEAGCSPWLDLLRRSLIESGELQRMIDEESLREATSNPAIFSFEEEARMFLDLRLAVSEEGWCVRQTSVGEVVSVLYGPCSDAKKVVLDPVPEVGKKELVELLNMHRNDFLRFLLGDGPSNLRLVPSLAQRPHKRVEHGHVA